MKSLLIIGYVALIISMFFSTINDFGDYANTPRQIYDSNNCNMFGAVLLWLFAFITNPLYYITVFAWWVLHVGRRD